MTKLTKKERITKDSYNTQSKNWEEYFSGFMGWPSQLAKFKELLPAGRVLEIGVGTGRDAEDLIKIGYDYVGTDISEGLLKVARKNLPGQIFIKQSVYELDFTDKFDGFWASAVLLHIPKARIDEALGSIKSVLKNTAVGFISIKDGVGEEMVKNKVGNLELERLFAYWTKAEFSSTLQKNGFDVVDYIYTPVSKTTNWHSFFVKKS